MRETRKPLSHNAVADILFPFIPCLSRHLGSPVYLISFFLHSTLFVALSSFNPACVISLLHASFHLRFGRPLLLFLGMSTSSILLNMCSSFILLTWPYHFSRFSVIFLDACTTLVVPIMCSFRILYPSLSLRTSISGFRLMRTHIVTFTYLAQSSPRGVSTKITKHAYNPIHTHDMNNHINNPKMLINTNKYTFRYWY